MGLDNPLHIIFLLILLLLVFGAKRLPEMGRSLGAGMRGFKESISGEGVQPTAVALQPNAVAQQPQPAATVASGPTLAPTLAPVSQSSDTAA